MARSGLPVTGRIRKQVVNLRNNRAVERLTEARCKRYPKESPKSRKRGGIANLRRLGGVSEAGASCRNPERSEGSLALLVVINVTATLTPGNGDINPQPLSNFGAEFSRVCARSKGIFQQRFPPKGDTEAGIGNPLVPRRLTPFGRTGSPARSPH